MFATTVAIGLFLATSKDAVVKHLLREGTNLAAAGQLRDAEIVFDLATALDPDSYETIGCRGLVRQMRGKKSAGQLDLGIACSHLLLSLVPYEADETRAAVLLERAQWRWDIYPEKAYSDLIQATRLQPNDSELWSYRAALATNLKRPEQALSDAAHAIAMDSTAGLAFMARGTVLAEAGRNVEAWADLEVAAKTLRTDTDHRGRLHFMRAYLLAQAGRKPAAIAELDECLKISPHNLEALVQRMQLVGGESKWTAAITWLDRQLERAPGDNVLQLNRAKMLETAECYNEATEAYKQVLNSDPKNVAAREGIIRALFKQAKTAESLTAAEELLEDEPTNLQALRGRAAVMCAAGFETEGLRALENYIAQDPRNEKLLEEACQFAYKYDRYAHCLKWSALQLRCNPRSAHYHHLAADCHYGLGHYREAIDAYSEAIRLEPDRRQALEYRSLAYLNIGDLEHAVADCETLRGLYPAYEGGRDLWAKLNEARKAKADATAMAKLDEAIREHPDNLEPLLKRARQFESAGLLERAVRDYDQALRLHPLNLQTRQSRFVDLLKLGQLKEAEADFAYIVEKDPARRPELEARRRELTEAQNGPPKPP